MKIFLDTANRKEIARWAKTGIIDGVTTNPSLIAKEEGGNIKQILQDICGLLPEGDVSIEVVELEPQAMLEQAQEIAQVADNVIVKIPFGEQYLSVIDKLTTKGIGVNVTLVFTPLQGLMVAKLGVDYISPFIGRWEDIGVDGVGLIEDFVEMIDTYEFDTEILAASIRTVMHWNDVMLAGADVVTLPPKLLEKATQHPLTSKGIELFDADWKKLGKAKLLD